MASAGRPTHTGMCTARLQLPSLIAARAACWGAPPCCPPPAVSGKVSLVNYGLTQPGLAQQLLEVVVAHERPDLAAARTELVAAMSSDKGQLAVLEDTLLRELSSATGEQLGGSWGERAGVTINSLPFHLIPPHTHTH